MPLELLVSAHHFDITGNDFVDSNVPVDDAGVENAWSEMLPSGSGQAQIIQAKGIPLGVTSANSHHVSATSLSAP